jgi:hypothetical protein
MTMTVMQAKTIFKDIGKNTVNNDNDSYEDHDNFKINNSDKKTVNNVDGHRGNRNKA